MVLWAVVREVGGYGKVSFYLCFFGLLALPVAVGVSNGVALTPMWLCDMLLDLLLSLVSTGLKGLM